MPVHIQTENNNLKKPIDKPILGHSIVKRVKTDNICNERHDSLNYASSGANFKKIYDKFQQFEIQQFQKFRKRV